MQNQRSRLTSLRPDEAEAVRLTLEWRIIEIAGYVSEAEADEDWDMAACLEDEAGRLREAIEALPVVPTTGSVRDALWDSVNAPEHGPAVEVLAAARARELDFAQVGPRR